MSDDTITALVDLVRALHRRADPETLLKLTDRAIGFVEREIEATFTPDNDETLEVVV